MVRARPATPPRAAGWLLQRLRPHADCEALLGDLAEEHDYLRRTLGVRQAHRWYWIQVLRCFPGFATQLVYWSIIMLGNYVTIAGRQLIKNWRYSLINMVGLAVALACCIVAWLNYDFSYGFDRFHTNAAEIYRVNSMRSLGDTPLEWGVSPMPLGPAIRDASPLVEEVVRISNTQGVVQHGQNVFTENIRFADPAFFDVFTFPLRSGSRDVLNDPGRVVLTPQAATRYFGDEDPMGQPMTIRLGDELHEVSVGAVVEEIPQNSSIQFDILTAYSNLGGDFDSWGRWGLVTFLRVSDPARVADLSSQLADYIAPQNAARPDWEIERYYLVPLEEMFLTSDQTRAYVLAQGVEPEAIVAPSIIAVLLLLMACFNFMNTAIAFAGRRLKEIGVRKVMGGHRRQLLSQFLGESMLLCVIAFGLSLLLAEVFAPAYSSLWPYLDLRISYVDNLPLLAFLGALLLTTGLVAGGYPAFYVSGFNPVSILKGRQQLGGLNRFTRTLLTFQFTIAIMVVMAAFVFTRNARFQEQIDLGYDEDMVLMVPLNDPGDFQAFRDAALQNPDVLSVSGTLSHLNHSFDNGILEVQAEGRAEPVSGEIDAYDVGDWYLETMGIEVVEGRPLSAGMESDREASVMVNQTLVRQFGLNEPVGRFVTFDSTRYEVVGVFEDFLDAGVWDPVDPAIFRASTPEQSWYLIVRAASGRLRQTDEFMRATWQELVPGQPYEGRYQDEMLAEAILINRGIRTTFTYIGILAVLIAAAGLFGLVSLAIARRTKEIGIRKVLGASVGSVGRLVNREFVLMLLVASVLATVGGYYVTKLLMDAVWAYHSGVGWLPAVLAIGSMFLVALLTVGRQVYRVAAANPVYALRDE